MTGDNNIDIGNQGVAVSGSTVVVNNSGQLRVMTASACYKRDIRDMGAATGRLMKLRPVTLS